MRILLLIATNFAVLAVIALFTSTAGINHWLTGQGLNTGMLLAYCAAFGFGGAFLSLLLSRPIAKWSTGAKVIDGSEGDVEHWLVSTVAELSAKAGIAMPQVAIYDSPEPNAFATGPTRNSALIAVSTGLLRAMDGREVVAVLGHEVAHAANGDMTLLTLLQGTVNTFTMFLARIVGFFVDKVLLKNERENGLAFGITVFICDLLFGLLGSLIVAAFSRRREFRADSGSAKLLGDVEPMIGALCRLEAYAGGSLPKSVQAFGINGNRGGFARLFSSHPPIAERVEALRHLGAQ